MTVHFSDAEEQAFKEASTNYFTDGEYVGVLVGSEVKSVGELRNKKLILKYKIESPQEHIGKIYFHFLPLNNEKAYGFLKNTLGQFGLNADRIMLKDIESEMQKLCRAQIVVNFLLKSKELNDRTVQNASIVSVDKDESYADMFE